MDFFRYLLPASRLGQEHESLAEFRQATAHFQAHQEKHYTLIVVAEPRRRRLLLGRKHRGFGTGMFNSFGGKIEPGETDGESASRELLEETGMDIPVHVMNKRRLGVLRFTFDDSPTELVCHLFKVDVDCSQKSRLSTPPTQEYPDWILPVDSETIRGCEEITPQWFDDWSEIPLDNMFADDSVWLTRVLSAQQPLLVDGWFHFLPGGQETNTILDYYLDIRPILTFSQIPKQDTAAAKTFTLEQRLFHELHDNKIHSPSIKEFKEAYAFANAVRSYFSGNAFDMVLDVAGGHGALAALFLIMTTARSAVVIDPAQVGQGSVKAAWGSFFAGKSLRYRHECLRTGLPAELAEALQTTTANRILVVGCHACQHLSDEILEISCRQGVNVALMPCCQKDPLPGSPWKAACKRLDIPIEKVMDLLLAGKAMSWSHPVPYDVRMKLMDASITPQNRIILCRAIHSVTQQQTRDAQRQQAHEKLEVAYKRAHLTTPSTVACGKSLGTNTVISLLPTRSTWQVLTAFLLGLSVSAVLLRSPSIK